MNNQRAFENFLRILNGKGRSVDDDGRCLYFPENHPGCGIGCQPGFREKFYQHKRMWDNVGFTIQDLSKYEDVRDFINGCSLEFLTNLQGFHDLLVNWYGLHLRKEATLEFAKINNVVVPDDIEFIA